MNIFLKLSSGTCDATADTINVREKASIGKEINFGARILSDNKSSKSINTEKTAKIIIEVPKPKSSPLIIKIA